MNIKYKLAFKWVWVWYFSYNKIEYNLYASNISSNNLIVFMMIFAYLHLVIPVKYLLMVSMRASFWD